MYPLLAALQLPAAMIPPGVRSQDLYDPETLRTFSLQFRDATASNRKVIGPHWPNAGGQCVSTRRT